MDDPKITNILATARPSVAMIGRDDDHITLYLDSLEKQTFKDFEVVIADCYYDKRQDHIVGDTYKGKRYPFTIRHFQVKSPWLDHGYWTGQAPWNQAAMLARGELLCLYGDCCEMPPDYLERIWSWYQQGRWCMGLVVYKTGGRLAVKGDLKDDGALGKYKDVLGEETGILGFKKVQDIGWDLASKLLRDSRWPFVEKVPGGILFLSGEGGAQQFHGYSTIPLEALLEVNGFDENFDGDKCILPGQMVYGQETKPIEEVQVGDLILTHRGRLRRVTKTYKRWYVGKIITFNISGGPPLAITPGHLMLVRRPSEKNNLSIIEWVRSEVLAEDFLRSKYHHQKRKHRLVFSAPKTHTQRRWIQLGIYKLKLTNHLARLIGYYISDGSASRYLSFTFDAKTEGYATEVLKLCNDELGFLKSHLPEREHGSISKDKGNSIRARFHVGRGFAQEWKAWLGDNAHAKRIPHEILYNSDLKLCEDLIETLWCGDGYGKTYVTVSTQLAYDVQQLLARLGKYSTIHKSVQKAGYGKGKEIYRIEIHEGQLLKHVKHTSHIEIDGKELRGNFFYRPIRRVEFKQYKGFVHHLEVEEDKTYQVNGVSVHNSLGDCDMGIRLNLAGYSNHLMIDRNVWIFENSHFAIPDDFLTYRGPSIRSNYSLMLWNKQLKRYRANSYQLTAEEIEKINKHALNWGFKDIDEWANPHFKTWLDNPPIFDMRDLRMDVQDRLDDGVIDIPAYYRWPKEK